VTPKFRLIADDADVTAAIAKRLVKLSLTDKKGMEADELTIEIEDGGGRVALPRTGVTLSLALGWEGGALVDKGRFEVDEVSHSGPPDTITITARAADFRGGLKDQREASYHDTTVGAILETIAARNGLAPAIHADLSETLIAHLDQTNESDANLITRLGKDYGAVATIKAGRLLFLPDGKGVTASGTVLGTTTIRRSEGDRHSFTSSDREGTTTGVKAKWHNHATGKAEDVLAGEDGGSVKTLKRQFPNAKEALAAAEAAMKKKKRSGHEFRVTLALGRPEILAAAPVRFLGWRPEIAAIDWITGDITHTLDASGGLTTEVVAEEQDDDGQATPE
jgi:hypothetical protein